MKNTSIAAVLGATLIGVSGAHAADLARKAPILKAPPQQLYDWTGFYLGVNIGGSVARDRTQLSNGTASPQVVLSPFGAIGGGQLGYNWQLNNDWLIGVETDIQGSGERDSNTCLLGCTPTASASFNQRIDWFGTTRARVGLVTGPVLGYFTGGVAYGHFRTSLTETTPAIGGTASFSADETRVGYTYGSGVEASLGGNWTGKIEYLYVDLGKRNYAFAMGPTNQTLETRIHDNIFRAGLNYRIGGTPAYMPAAYNWSGFYIGGNVGSVLGRNNSSLSQTAGTAFFDLVPDGYGGGGQIGYNWQAGAWVFGLEADLQGNWSKDNDACLFGCSVANAVNIKQTLPWLGTVRGRLGYTLGSTLFYGTGGLAYGETRTHFDEMAAGTTFSSVDVSHTRSGYTVGAGIESPLQFFGFFGPNWTVKTEYLYVDLGRTTDTFVTPSFGTQTFSTRTQEHVFRGGVNYHFNVPTL
jgi:outer membrane immunogenic protein